MTIEEQLREIRDDQETIIELIGRSSGVMARAITRIEDRLRGIRETLRTETPQSGGEGRQNGFSTPLRANIDDLNEYLDAVVAEGPPTEEVKSFGTNLGATVRKYPDGTTTVEEPVRGQSEERELTPGEEFALHRFNRNKGLDRPGHYRRTLTLKGAAERFGCSVSFLNKLIRNGDLKGFKDGPKGAYLISGRELSELRERRPELFRRVGFKQPGRGPRTGGQKPLYNDDPSGDDRRRGG